MALTARAEPIQVAERRARAARQPARRERLANVVDGSLVLAGAVALALLAPGPAAVSPLALAAFVAVYACAARVEFEIGAGAAVPTQLVFIPMLLVLPPSVVPLAVAAGLVLSNAPGYLRGTIHPERSLGVVTSAAYAFGPSLVLLAYGDAPAGWEHWPLYLALVAAGCAADLLHTVAREAAAIALHPRELVHPLAVVYGIDALLTPAGLLLAFSIAPQPLAILAVLPLVVLLGLFARERSARIDHALELEGARQVNERLDELVHTDPLTGVSNRRAWEDALPTLLENARAAGRPLCVAMLDLDHFKRFNDAHGHPAGDELLRRAAAAWRSQLRPGDLLARVGGEEFGVALPGCEVADAVRLAERLRRSVPGRETCSIGIAGYQGDESPQALIARADQALYTAKKRGRDRVVVAGGTRRGARQNVRAPLTGSKTA